MRPLKRAELSRQRRRCKRRGNRSLRPQTHVRVSGMGVERTRNPHEMERLMADFFQRHTAVRIAAQGTA